MPSGFGAAPGFGDRFDRPPWDDRSRAPTERERGIATSEGPDNGTLTLNIAIAVPPRNSPGGGLDAWARLATRGRGRDDRPPPVNRAPRLRRRDPFLAAGFYVGPRLSSFDPLSRSTPHRRRDGASRTAPIQRGRAAGKSLFRNKITTSPEERSEPIHRPPRRGHRLSPGGRASTGGASVNRRAVPPRRPAPHSRRRAPRADLRPAARGRRPPRSSAAVPRRPPNARSRRVLGHNAPPAASVVSPCFTTDREFGTFWGQKERICLFAFSSLPRS